MKIALCQINTTLGDFKYNSNLILSNYERSLEMDAELVVFPEMAISGYPAQDLLLNSNFIEYNQNSLEIIKNEIGSIPIVIGTIFKENYKEPLFGTKFLYNSLVVIQNKEIIHRYNKQKLPNYDIFDEKRYFQPGSPGDKKNNYHVVDILGSKIGFQICEDMWNTPSITSDQILKGKAECIINISASPYEFSKTNYRLFNFQSEFMSTKLNIPFFYCNLVGAQDEIIFDGSSFAISKFNESLLFASSFKEDILIADTKLNFGVESRRQILNKPSKEFIQNCIKNDHDAIILGIVDFFKKTKNKKAVIGLSGGIDSAITAYFAAKALGSENILGLIMPSKYSSDHSIFDAIELSKSLQIETLQVPINKIVDVYQNNLPNLFDDEENNLSSLADENIQSRIRANILMYFSNKYGYLLLSTSNKTELALGYSTLYGDMCGALSPIGDLNKSEVYEIANWINGNKFYNHENRIIIPRNSIQKKPSAELKEDQVDPFDYEKISDPIDSIITNNGARDAIITWNFDEHDKIHEAHDLHEISLQEVIDIQKPIFRSEFKRNQSNIILKLKKKSFGTGRRFPIAANYDEFTDLINMSKKLKENLGRSRKSDDQKNNIN